MKASPISSFLFRWISPAVLLMGLAAPANGAETSAAVATSASSTTPAPAVSTASEKTSAGVPSIFVCGDSTAKNTGRGVQGWGTAIEAYIDPTNATVKNVAHAGTSSLTYFNGDWPAVVPQIKVGDYVLIVFGINDGGLSTPAGLGDETKDVTIRNQTIKDAHTYGWYMSKMATDSLAKGAHVYLLTVTARNEWTNPKATFKDATIINQQEGYTPTEDKLDRANWGKYPQWTKDVGAKLHLPVLDLTTLEGDRYDKLGREKVMVNYPADHNHTSPAGADLIASYIVSGLKAFKNSPFTAMLSDKGKAIETADTKYVIENPATDATKPAASPSASATTAAK